MARILAISRKLNDDKRSYSQGIKLLNNTHGGLELVRLTDQDFVAAMFNLSQADTTDCLALRDTEKVSNSPPEGAEESRIDW